MKRFSYLLFLALLALSASLSAQTLDEVLAKNFEARGGLDKIKAMQSFRATGTISIQGGMVQGEFTMWQKRPNKLRMEVSMQGMNFTQGYDGETAWLNMPPAMGGSGKPEKADGPQAEQLIEQSDMDGFLVDYKGKGHQVELMGKADVEGTEAYDLKVTLAQGQVLHVFIDAENYIEIQMTASRELPGMGETEVDIVMGDYKEVEGLMIPHAISTKMQGQTFSELIIKTIEGGVEVEDSFFVMEQDSPNQEPQRH